MRHTKTQDTQFPRKSRKASYNIVSSPITGYRIAISRKSIPNETDLQGSTRSYCIRRIALAQIILTNTEILSIADLKFDILYKREGHASSCPGAPNASQRRSSLPSPPVSRSVAQFFAIHHSQPNHKPVTTKRDPPAWGRPFRRGRPFACFRLALSPLHADAPSPGARDGLAVRRAIRCICRVPKKLCPALPVRAHSHKQHPLSLIF